MFDKISLITKTILGISLMIAIEVSIATPAIANCDGNTKEICEKSTCGDPNNGYCSKNGMGHCTGCVWSDTDPANCGPRCSGG